MNTTAETLHCAARVIETQRHCRIDVVTAIRIAAGPGPAGHELAEQTLCVFADHLDYPSDDLARWSSRQPTDHIIAELQDAADAAERTGA